MWRKNITNYSAKSNSLYKVRKKTNGRHTANKQTLIIILT